jgi:mono/diheme cytochrome c family protein
MNQFRRNRVLIVLCFVAAAVMLMLPNAFGDEKAKPLDGKALFEQKCLKCHKNTKFKDLASDRKGWVLTLSRMQRGTCPMTDEELELLADYLSKVYGD